MAQALLKPPQVTAKYGIPVETLKYWRYLGKGPAYVRLGRHVHYAPADIEAYIEARKVTPADERVG